MEANYVAFLKCSKPLEFFFSVDHNKVIESKCCYLSFKCMFVYMYIYKREGRWEGGRERMYMCASFETANRCAEKIAA